MKPLALALVLVLAGCYSFNSIHVEEHTYPNFQPATTVASSPETLLVKRMVNSSGVSAFEVTRASQVTGITTGLSDKLSQALQPGRVVVCPKITLPALQSAPSIGNPRGEADLLKHIEVLRNQIRAQRMLMDGLRYRYERDCKEFQLKQVAPKS